MPEDRRAMLEALAYGEDPDLKPSDRLRALEQLHELDRASDAAVDLAHEVLSMSEEALDRELKGVLVEVPRPAKHDERQLERKVAERVRELLHREELPPALQRRVEQEAEKRVGVMIREGKLRRVGDEDREQEDELPPPYAPDDPEMARKMEQARREGRNPFELPGTTTRIGGF